MRLLSILKLPWRFVNTVSKKCSPVTLIRLTVNSVKILLLKNQTTPLGFLTLPAVVLAVKGLQPLLRIIFPRAPEELEENEQHHRAFLRFENQVEHIQPA